jgi:hypothetical protein
MRRIILPLLLLAAQPLLAAYADRDLVIPVVGRAAGGSGRLFLTALWITNSDDHPAVMTLSYLESGHANRSPRKTSVTLPPRQTYVVDPLGPPILPAADGIGALHIESNADVVASARIYGYVPGASATTSVAMAMTGIPTRLGIGNGQSAVLHGGGSRDAQYKLYVIETSGAALSVVVAVEDLHGQVLGEKRLFLDGFEHIATETRQMFPSVNLDHAMIRIRGVNGNGRVVAAGTQIIAGSQDGCSYEMSFAPEPRTRIRAPEAAVYIAIAALVAIALLRRRQ